MVARIRRWYVGFRDFVPIYLGEKRRNLITISSVSTDYVTDFGGPGRSDNNSGNPLTADRSLAALE